MCCQFLCILPSKFILIPFPAHPQQVSSFFRHPSSQRRAVFMSKRQELPWYGGVPPPPRPFSPRHETWVPTWIKRPPTWDMGTYPLPLLPTSDIWWSSLETCSNLFTAGPPPTPMVLISGGGHWNKYDWQADYMHLLEYCLVTAHKRSLGQGNIFTSICHSVHRGGFPCKRSPVLLEWCLVTLIIIFLSGRSYWNGTDGVTRIPSFSWTRTIKWSSLEKGDF